MVLGEGFEPPKAEPPDLQSGAFVHFANLAGQYSNWSWRRDSNPQPSLYKSVALPLSYASLYHSKLFTSELSEEAKSQA